MLCMLHLSAKMHVYRLFFKSDFGMLLLNIGISFKNLVDLTKNVIIFGVFVGRASIHISLSEQIAQDLTLLMVSVNSFAQWKQNLWSSAQIRAALSQTVALGCSGPSPHSTTQYGSHSGSRRSGWRWHEGATLKKNIWVTGQLPALSITINGPTHTPPSQLMH